MAMKKANPLFNDPVNVKQLIEKLSFDEDNLEQAAIENARLMFEAGRYRVKKMRRRAKASLAYDRAYADKRLYGRKKKDSGGKKTFTEGAVSDLALTSSEVNQLHKIMDEAYAQEEMSKVLLECFRVRRDMIKAIAVIRSSEISSELRSVRENMKRSEMDKMRQDVRARVNALADEDEED